MPAPQLSRRRLALGTRVLVWLSLGVYLFTATGVPLPIPARIASNERFPCENHGCGCATAAQCWQQCCCYNDQQKLAWAKAHGVTPPEHVVRRAKSKPASAAAPKSRGCCAQRAKDTCAADPTPSTETRATEAEPVWYSLWQAQKCRGQGQHWILGHLGLMPPVADPALAPPHFTARVNLARESLVSRTSRPDVPPPRLARLAG